MSPEDFEKLWQDTKHPLAFSAPNSVYNELVRQGYRTSYPRVLKLMSEIPSYQQNARSRKRLETWHTNLDRLSVGKSFQADLFFMPTESEGKTAALLLADEADNFLYVKALPNKTGKEVAKALEAIIEENSLDNFNFLLTDAGSEFKARAVQNVLKRHNIRHQIARGRHKAFLAERLTAPGTLQRFC